VSSIWAHAGISGYNCLVETQRTNRRSGCFPDERHGELHMGPCNNLGTQYPVSSSNVFAEHGELHMGPCNITQIGGRCGVPG
jgi:hypothetical protein